MVLFIPSVVLGRKAEKITTEDLSIWTFQTASSKKTTPLLGRTVISSFLNWDLLSSPWKSCFFEESCFFSMQGKQISKAPGILGTFFPFYQGFCGGSREMLFPGQHSWTMTGLLWRLPNRAGGFVLTVLSFFALHVFVCARLLEIKF